MRLAKRQTVRRSTQTTCGQLKLDRARIARFPKSCLVFACSNRATLELFQFLLQVLRKGVRARVHHTGTHLRQVERLKFIWSSALASSLNAVRVKWAKAKEVAEEAVVEVAEVVAERVTRYEQNDGREKPQKSHTLSRITNFMFMRWLRDVWVAECVRLFVNCTVLDFCV